MCSMLACPESDASAAPTVRDTCPANGIRRARAARAMAKYDSRVSWPCTLMKSTPSLISESTAGAASAGDFTSRCGIGTSPPSRYGPDDTMRGPISVPRAISPRHAERAVQSLAMSRTPVTPLAMYSLRTSRPPGMVVWTCMSHNPGMRNFPRPSMTRVPAGTLVDAAGPSATIRVPRMTTVRFSRGVGLRPSMTVTRVNAVTSIDCAAVPAHDRTPMHGSVRKKAFTTEDTGVTEETFTHQNCRQTTELEYQEPLCSL